mmetsp:Transcript_6471/g.21635  ORF Transcript_6471/g.21635 Transcript_6471/m.21635 type:complete len:267 (+) Transcript_6471:706-1506(+)
MAGGDSGSTRTCGCQSLCRRTFPCRFTSRRRGTACGSTRRSFRRSTLARTAPTSGGSRATARRSTSSASWSATRRAPSPPLRAWSGARSSRPRGSLGRGTSSRGSSRRATRVGLCRMATRGGTTPPSASWSSTSRSRCRLTPRTSCRSGRSACRKAGSAATALRRSTPSLTHSASSRSRTSTRWWTRSTRRCTTRRIPKGSFTNFSTAAPIAFSTKGRGATRSCRRSSTFPTPAPRSCSGARCKRCSTTGTRGGCTTTGSISTSTS